MTDIETAYSQIWRKYDSANVAEIRYNAGVFRLIERGDIVVESESEVE